VGQFLKGFFTFGLWLLRFGGGLDTFGQGLEEGAAVAGPDELAVFAFTRAGAGESARAGIDATARPI
jgi:hypothetical protein